MRGLLILFAIGAAAAADDLSAAADKALAAFRAKGDLKELAAADDPDPWLVADELCARGEYDAAELFAKAAPRKATDRLPAYVASRRRRAAETQVEAHRAKRAAAVAAHREAVTLLRGGDRLAAWDTVRDAPDLGEAGVFPVQLAFLRADILQQLQRSDEAERVYASTARAAEELGWLTIAELSLNRAGLLAYQRAGWDDALAAWQDRLRVLDELERGPDGETLHNLGLAQLALGDPAAPGSFERASGVFLEHGRQADAAGSLQMLGSARESVSDHVEALDAQLRAFAIFESLHDASGIAGIVTNIGNTRESLGDYGMAADCHARALRLYEQIEDQVGIATALNNLGVVLLRLGEYAEAFECWERALRLSEERQDLEGVGMTLGNLGSLHQRLGDTTRALECHGKALAIQEGLGNRASVALSLGNLGEVHRELGDPVKAVACHERALDIYEELEDRGGIARALNNLASVQADLGRLPQALEFKGRALAILEDLDEPGHVALTLQGLGAICYRLGDYSKACEMQSRALALAERIGFLEIVVGALRGRAFALLAMGRPSDALADTRRAASELAVLVGGLGDEQGAGAREHLRHVFEAGAAASAVLRDPREASFFLESGRAGGLIEGLAVRGWLAAALPEELRNAEARARDREASALWQYRRVLDQGGDASAPWKEVEAARAEVIAAVQRIQREAKAQAALLYPEADSLDTIRATLRPGEALVSYALLEKSALALVVTPGGARIVDLDGKLPEAVEAFQRAVARPDERGVAAPPHERLPFLRERLANLLVEPLKLDDKTTRLLISPDGLLAYVPFSVLTDREVVYVPSGTTYRLLMEERGRGGEKVLAIGDPDYSGADKTAVSIYAGDEGLEQLPGTRAEAQAVGDIVLLGKQATRAAFGEALGKQPRWRAVHFACHGSVDPERPVLSSLALTAQGEDDGFLKCLDVYQMRIPADLVVLSACETGKGKIYRAEGVIGFTRAFMFAGAPRVIVSLWKVDDHATRALMEKFYEAWKPGKVGAAAALRAAQEHVRSQEKWKHPYFWAAWQLWGLPE